MQARIVRGNDSLVSHLSAAPKGVVDTGHTMGKAVTPSCSIGGNTGEVLRFGGGKGKNLKGGSGRPISFSSTGLHTWWCDYVRIYPRITFRPLATAWLGTFFLRFFCSLFFFLDERCFCSAFFVVVVRFWRCCLFAV